MENWRKEQKDEKGVERLGPVNEDDLFEWEAVINGKGIGSGYDGEPFCPCPLFFTALSRDSKNKIEKRY
jgi:ubiquitin-protein ligase